MKLKYKIWLDDEGKAFGEGPYRLLKGVQASGSLAAAAKEQNMSYSRAHGLMKMISSKLGFALLEGHAGGSGGGGAQVTSQAEDLMRRYEAMIRESAESLERIYIRHFGLEAAVNSGVLQTETNKPKVKKNKQAFGFPANWKPLCLAKGDIVSLTGGGGKSSIMYALANDLSLSGAKVILTTTTKVYLPAHGVVHRLIVAEERGIIEQVRQGVKQNEVVALGSGVRDGKLLGLSPDLVDKLAEMSIADYILVEADGAAGRPFKAPNDHEPVIPHSSTVVLNVVGLNALETPMSEEYCHRPALVASICGLPVGARLDSQAIADVMLSAKGGHKNVPRGALWLPVINKIDSIEDMPRAAQIARALVKAGADDVVFSSVLKGQVQLRLWGGEK
ncbi:MAG: selenium cofactor biosynthesis protein YqeC [Clostridiales bacterium]|nr:selenium cofactor biosynthesis protein YqeC [Clostridiales bacterium]